MPDIDRLCVVLSERGFSVQLVSLEFAEYLFRQATPRHPRGVDRPVRIGSPTGGAGTAT